MTNLWPVLLLFAAAIPVWMPLSHVLYAVIIAISVFMFIKHRPGWVFSGIEVPFAILCVVYFLASMFSPEPAQSIVYLKKLTPYLLLFLLPNLRLTREAKKRLLTVWLGVTMAHSLWVVGQFFTVSGRPNGLFGTGGYMHFAHFIYIPMAVCLAFVSSKNSRTLKKIAVATLVTGSLALFATYTRGALIAFIGGIGVFWIIQKKWIWIVCSVLLGILLAGGIMTADPQSDFGKSISSIVHPFDRENDRVTASNMPRVFLWQASLNMAKEHPVLGIGPLRFREELGNYLPNVPEAGEIDFTHAHSIYLDTLATMGVTGLLALLYFLGALFFVLAKLYLRTEDTFDRALLLAGIVALVCLCLGGFTEMCFRRAQSAMNLCFLIGLALGCAATNRRSA